VNHAALAALQAAMALKPLPLATRNHEEQLSAAQNLPLQRPVTCALRRFGKRATTQRKPQQLGW